MTAPAFGGLADATVALIGAGKMGCALLSGLSRAGTPKRLLVVEPQPSEALMGLRQELGFDLAATAPASAAPVTALVLSIKPQQLDDAAQALLPLIGANTLLLSILAGKRIVDLKARLPANSVVRAMPNTPAAIGQGVTGAFASAETTSTQRALAQSLLAAMGSVEWLDAEEQIDAVTAVSGSGPAYVFYLAECLAKAGADLGLPEELAARLARATVAGSGALLAQAADASPRRLLENVTSPGGTTAAALKVLMAEDGLEPLMARAVAAAKARAAELAG